ncbi:hypothetical protein [Flavobacterium sp.]|uniref:hypothetical protein n=1 Tax=Flavobacterium sp. TaxID=239 RepID=UPI0035273DA2
MSQIALFEINNTFKITGRGVVFSGKIINNGSVAKGNFLEFKWNNTLFKRKIIAIEIINFKNPLQQKLNVLGIVIETLNNQEMLNLHQWNPNKTIAKVLEN